MKMKTKPKPKTKTLSQEKGREHEGIIQTARSPFVSSSGAENKTTLTMKDESFRRRAYASYSCLMRSALAWPQWRSPGFHSWPAKKPGSCEG
jgi:hypothetical protein